MSRFSVTVLTSIALAIALNACNTAETRNEEELRKDEYLKNNFPAKKQGKNTETPVETTFDK